MDIVDNKNSRKYGMDNKGLHSPKAKKPVSLKTVYEIFCEENSCMLLSLKTFLKQTNKAGHLPKIVIKEKCYILKHNNNIYNFTTTSTSTTCQR